MVLDNRALRTSALWERRHAIGVAPGVVQRFEEARLAYFDHLVARSDRGAAGTRVAWHHVTATMEDHDATLATTVIEPVVNPAALPLLRGIGFVTIGHVDEQYPVIGPLRSALHLLTREAFEHRITGPDARRFALRMGIAPGHRPGV